MSEEKHEFKIESTWTGPSGGDGLLRNSGEAVRYGMPEGLGGAPGRTNPEEMLISAVAACYSITLAVLAERRRLPVARIDLTARGEVVRQPGGILKFVSISLPPRITLDGGDPAQIETLRDFALKAEQYCPISNAVRGNVEISVDPEIITG